MELLSRLIRQSYRDVAERFDLSADNCPKHPSNCTIEWIKHDFARGVRYVVLEVDAIAVGCAALEMVQDGLCYLERLAVLPRDRRKGYGQMLVQHILKMAKMCGARHASIGIIADQTDLKIWYRKIGFVETETRAFAHLPFNVTFLINDLLA